MFYMPSLVIFAHYNYLQNNKFDLLMIHKLKFVISFAYFKLIIYLTVLLHMQHGMQQFRDSINGFILCDEVYLKLIKYNRRVLGSNRYYSGLTPVLPNIGLTQCLSQS